MAGFVVNAHRFDPYKNFKFRVKWDGRYVAGVNAISALRRTTQVVEYRDGGDPSTVRKSPGRTSFEPITSVAGSRTTRVRAVGQQGVVVRSGSGRARCPWRTSARTS